MHLALLTQIHDLAAFLSININSMLKSETPEALRNALYAALNIEQIDNPWSITYQAEHTDAYKQDIEQRWQLKQRQYTQITEINEPDETGLFLFTQDIILLEIMRLSCVRHYESVDQANQVKQQIKTQVRESELRCSDAMYGIWRDWKVLLREAIDQQAASLPHIMYIKRQESLPALLVSYQLYGSIDQEQDLIDRNHINHPSFCPADEYIEVLSKTRD